jgi:NADPH2:quinone reductase
MEGAGVVEALGPDVTEFKVGDRVAYCGGTPGSYSEVRAMPADRLVPLPSDISCETAAAIMLKGLTAEYLLFRTARVQPGQTLLIHAAAGGVGLLVCAWAKAMGATVIGTVGSDEKAALARQHGCHHPIVYTRENFKARVLELTGGKGVSAVFDSVGKPTLADSIGCVDFFGQVVSFGQSGGTPDPVATSQLAPKSACLSRPTLFHHTARRADLLAMSSRLFEAVRAGILSLRIGGRYPLAQAAQAHRELESRTTTGSLLLMP